MPDVGLKSRRQAEQRNRGAPLGRGQAQHVGQPHCGCPTCWRCPRPNGAPRFRCSACRRDFSPTSGTLFAFHKLEIRDYLAAVVIFCDEVKGKAALALSRDFDTQYMTAFALASLARTRPRAPGRTQSRNCALFLRAPWLAG